MDWSYHCHNCGRSLPNQENFCPDCGQKNKPPIPKVWDLISDVIGDTFNLDSRFFQTVGRLFMPGALTLAFFRGEHKKYFSPFRVLLISLILALACIHLYYKDALDIKSPVQGRKVHHTLAIDSLHDRFDRLKPKFYAAYPDLDSSVIIDLKDDIVAPRDSQVMGDWNLNIGLLKFNFGDQDSVEQGVTNVSIEDLVYKPLDKLGVETENEDWFNTMIARQVVKMMRDPGQYVGSLLSNLVWMVILMIPFIALILKLLYIRRKYYYVQHVVFLYHVSAFHVMTFILGMLLSIPFGNWMFMLSFFAGLIYHIVAFFRVYKDHWFKGLIKFGIYSLWGNLVVATALAIYFLVNIATF